ncbi:uncharacterized protein LOC129594659 [Paramacrobiotus metropolitanus]|uniref:uncharacterized protein LOC129594659 n=1 Tax=Paramacrobiotus metropolitanus TaxID=2943436 RepID=UPI002445DA2E|nr:uncharacterized protein LOC129594659 [Paramacrobiotus metropolitanus]
MLRILCAVTLLSGAVYAQLAMPDLMSRLSQMFGPNCTIEDQSILFHCSMNIQNQSLHQEPVFRRYGNIFWDGNITDEQAKTILDYFCGIVSTTSTCLGSISSGCTTSPFMAWSLHMNEYMLRMCAAPGRYKHFPEIVRCNKKLDVYNTIGDDRQLLQILGEVGNMTISAMGPDVKIASPMELPPHIFKTLFCRLFSRIEEMFPLDKVNATCGADAHTVYTGLYKNVAEIYQCPRR